MKNYMRILAGILAVTMTVCAMPASTINAASPSDSSEETTYEETNETSEESESVLEEEVTQEESDGKAESDATTTEESTETEKTQGKSAKVTQDKITGNTAVQTTEDTAEQDTVNLDETDEDAAEAGVETQAEDYLDVDKIGIWDNNTGRVEIQSAENLILLSNCNPESIQNHEIWFNVAGQIDLTKTYEYGGKTYSYKGIGSSDSPFKGKITGNIGGIKIKKALFGGLSSEAHVLVNRDADYLSIIWCGEGSESMITDVYQFDSGEDHRLPVRISNDSTGTFGSLIGIVKAGSDEISNPTLTIDEDVVNYSNASNVRVVTSAGNAGLICNTLQSGTICLNGVTFPTKSYTVSANGEYNDKNTSAAGNAGGVIGVMESNTTLSIKSNIEIATGTTITATGNAGGLVGLMQDGAKIVTEKGSTTKITEAKVNGGISAGGLVGTAKNIVLEEPDGSIEIKSPTVKGTSENSNVGGFIGAYTLETKAEKNYTIPTCINLTSPTVSTTGRNTTNSEVSNAGGYFGYLKLEGKWNCTFGSLDDKNPDKFDSTHGDNGNQGRSYGAIAGKVVADMIESIVKVQNMTITSTYNNRATYHGGLIGEVGSKDNSKSSVYLEVSNVAITVYNPYADGNERGFGGLAGRLAQGSILKTENQVKISTDTTAKDPKIWEGGGLVGWAEKESVIELSGETDLSGAHYIGNRYNAGWLVGYQDCALIYAKGDGNGNGWTYKRGSAGKQYYENSVTNVTNDIANYGQIIRLNAEDGNDSTSTLSSDLISIDENTHRVELKESYNWSGDITLDSADEFALLSIAWNSHGYFSADSTNTITEKNWNALQSKNITLSKDINLIGSGITGLSRDTNENEDNTYSGTFDGKEHTITLAIGEAFGYVGEKETLATLDDDGCGKVYAADYKYHNAQGLFAKTSGATIQNLTIAGTINLSNRYDSISAGGIAAVTSGTTTISNVSAKEAITAYANACDDNKTLSVGGLYGEDDGAEGKVTLADNTKVFATISLTGNVANKSSCVYAGEVLGQIKSDKFTLNVDGLTVGDEEEKSSIKTDSSDYAYVGGLVGIIKPRAGANNTIENRWIYIRNLTFDNFAIKAENATEICGGLLGSIWSNVGVYFMEVENSDNYAVTVKDSSVSAPKAAGVGGLAYRSSGVWEVQDQGIDIQSLNITAKGDIGLLVCHGESTATVDSEKKSTAFIDGKDVDLGALYLLLTKNWNNSYNLAKDININQTNGIFDEFVAYTAIFKNEITWNGQNGVISLATKDGEDGRVGVAESEAANCTTYQNRTEYGNQHKANACSRYYYDLDESWKDLNSNVEKASNGIIDTPQELLLWSVCRYASDNIKHCFWDAKDANGNIEEKAFTDLQRNTIGSNSTEKVTTFDMRKYSYYPIDISSDLTVKNAKFIFHNQEIETAESDNKSTQKLTGETDWSQHYTMHCGLFLSQIASNETTVTVNNVSFSGSIGKVTGEASGVLFAKTVAGSANNTGALKIATVELKDIDFNGLKVTDCGDNYAPLLINSIGSYTTLDVNGITVSDYTEGTAVASSLIGNVGSANAKQINLSFLNIVLPDEKVENDAGIFSHATLLESFVHDGTSSVATYNFYMGEEWKDEEYTHGVTYGYEITETTEYPRKQLWYYDEENYESNDNLVHTDAPGTFSSKNYLPYVCQKYSEADMSHEIKVNQRVADIIHGCGTYGHPYKITSEREMTILSEYMATGTARTDWRVTITGDQSVNHVCDKSAYSYSTDKTYQFDGTDWVQVTKYSEDGKEVWKENKDSNDSKITLDKDFMLQYLLNAYYDLQGIETEGTYQLKLSNFSGFGIATRPFRGVLTSTEDTTVILSGASTSNGLIPYSYGSVVKNLKISYVRSNDEENTAVKTLSYNGTKTSVYYPDVCFGGVIGCVLGGDNIIDNVTVTIADNWLKIDGDGKKHLIPVGGYVGIVSGGGVIFRDMTDETGLTSEKVDGATNVEEDDEYANLYVNPYVGRVLDGFAFYEKNSSEDNVVNSLENTDKNYKIITLDRKKTDAVTTSNDEITVGDSKGLLILSAIVNSGAASGGENNAYSRQTLKSYQTSDKTTIYKLAGAYGKVRNALYSEIGKSVDDAETAKSDDQNAVSQSNLPYLIQQYCGGVKSVFELTSAAKIQLKADANMAEYGTGYQGMAARYVSSAILQGEDKNASGIVPELSSFDGNGNIVTLGMQVKEYVDDDFTAAAVGGIVNLLRIENETTSLAQIQNVTLTGKVELQYYDSAGKTVAKVIPKENTEEKIEENEKAIVDVGGFAGAISGLSAASGKTTGTISFDSVTLKDLTVTGSRNAGGLLGSSKKTEKLAEDEEGTALLIKSATSVFSVDVAVNNTDYSNLTVTAQNAAGGYVGYIESDVESSVTVTDSERTIGDNSTIGNTDNTTVQAGGAFGYVKSTLNVNIAEESKKATLQDVSVTARDFAGGFVGKIDGSPYSINKVTYQNGTEKNAIVTVNAVTNYAGGIVGVANGNDTCKIENCEVVEATIKSKNEKGDESIYGGHGGIAGRVENAFITIGNSVVQDTTITGGKSGGILGSAGISVTIKNCKVQAENNRKNITGTETAGGMIGLSNAKGAKIQLEQCYVQNMGISSGNWGCGGMLGDVDWNSALDTLYLFDCAVKESEVIGTVDAATAGGYVGDIRGNLTASNLLLSDVKIHTNSKNKVGMVIGMADSKTQKVAVAGLSIQSVTAYGRTKQESITDLYGVIANETTEQTKKNMSDHSYFAFADYSGVAAKQVGLYDDIAAVDPYVVTGSRSSLPVYENDTATAKYLFGDGASWAWDEESLTTEAQKIWKNKDATKDGHYAYDKTGVDSGFELDSVLSTYNKNQDSSVENNFDFPVLQVTSGNTEVVTNYLDILTNGGFTAANKQNTATEKHVEAETEVYEYNKNGKFVKSGGTKAALQVVTDSENEISFATTTDYDNTKNRFTLLEVTFTEKDKDNVKHQYKVLVPVLVRRMLEIDFIATLTYGTDFNKLNYNNLESHVLESFGNPITGYLTYRYNSAGGEYTDYGWDSYINAGGDVTVPIKKSICFNIDAGKKLPTGTQLTLINPIDGKAYYYTASGSESEIKLEKFVDSTGKNSYVEPSIGELLPWIETPTQNGAFVKVDENGKPEGVTETEGKTYPKPTVKIKTEDGGYNYYRLAVNGEAGTHTIAVDTDAMIDKEGKSAITENYYLVITVPEKSESNILNGYLDTKIDENCSIPNHVSDELRKPDINNETEDKHSNTASTYVLSSGYKQELKESSKITDLSTLVSVANSSLKVDVIDKITFPNSQAYNEDDDQLYLKIAASLQNTVDGKISAAQFPSGTSGRAWFYVYTETEDGTKTYYKYEEDEWKKADSTVSSINYEWVSDGGNMELPLSTDGTLSKEKAVSLQSLRDWLKSQPNAGVDSTFYVEVQMNATIPASGLDVIPTSKAENGSPTNYTKLVYTSQLSTVWQSLDYSNNRGSVPNTKTAYYREEPAGATLTYEPDQIDQLGINMWDLRYLDASKEHSLIDTTAVYNLSEMKDLEDVLRDSTGVKFTLQLLPKDTAEGKLEDYGAALTKDAEKYLSVELKSAESGAKDAEGNVDYDTTTGTWSWTVPKSSYWTAGTTDAATGTETEGSLRTDSPIFNGSVLTQQIQLKVDVVNVEKLNHLYSNYKVVLTAEILDEDGKTAVLNTTKSDNIIYTLARILPQFVEPTGSSDGSGN